MYVCLYVYTYVSVSTKETVAVWLHIENASIKPKWNIQSMDLNLYIQFCL